MNKKVGGKKSLTQLPIIDDPKNHNAGSNRNGKARPCNPGHKPNYNDGVAVPGK